MGKLPSQHAVAVRRLAALQRSGFQEAEIARLVEDDVVEQVDADDGSGCFELRNNVDVALGGLQAAAWMIMSDDDGQDDALVFVGLKLPAQPLGRLSNVGGEVVELGFVERESH